MGVTLVVLRSFRVIWNILQYIWNYFPFIFIEFSKRNDEQFLSNVVRFQLLVYRIILNAEVSGAHKLEEELRDKDVKIKMFSELLRDDDQAQNWHREMFEIPFNCCFNQRYNMRNIIYGNNINVVAVVCKR